MGSRIVCLSCGMKTTVDLCGKEECIASNMMLDVCGNLISPHLPSHDIMKLRTTIHPYYEYRQVYRGAPAALKRVRQLFADLESYDVQKDGDDEGSTRNRNPECIICGERTSLPCWYCIECEGASPDSGCSSDPLLTPQLVEDVFVCVSCDDRYGGVTRGNPKHRSIHTLVCCRSPHTHQDTE